MGVRKIQLHSLAGGGFIFIKMRILNQNAIEFLFYTTVFPPIGIKLPFLEVHC